MIAGTIKRFASKPPEPDLALLAEFREFVRAWLRKHLVPLGPEVDRSFETWLAKTNYPEWRKVELRAARESYVDIFENRKNLDVDSFMKDEGYAADEFKHARGINSRTDAYKTAVGPIFKLIEEALFALPEFIKKVPVAERAQYIFDRIYREGGKYIATDYTSFEALFTRLFMESCEFELYEYMTSALPEAHEFRRHMDEVLAGQNKCTFQHFIVWVLATRMSGEMCTSLGNGFSNLMLLEFALYKFGSRGEKVVEGDDGLCRVEGSIPTEEFFARLGMKIKLVEWDELSKASFCGLLFDEEEKVIVADPKKVLASFGWTSHRYSRSTPKLRKQLLRIKALSYAHQYPGCPIISELAHKMLELTRDVRIIRRSIVENFGWWERETLGGLISQKGNNRWFVDEPIKQQPGPRTRELVEVMFGIPTAAQLLAEQTIAEMTELAPFELPMIDFPEVWAIYFDRYVLDMPAGSQLQYPGHLWEKMAGHEIEWELT